MAASVSTKQLQISVEIREKKLGNCFQHFVSIVASRFPSWVWGFALAPRS